MGKLSHPSFSMEHAVSSEALRKLTSVVSREAVAAIAHSDDNLFFKTSLEHSDMAGAAARASDQKRKSLNGTSSALVVTTSKLVLTAQELQDLDRSIAATRTAAGGDWRGISLTLSDGRMDRVALQLNPNEDFDMTCAYLQRVWPIVRRDCLEERWTRATDGIAPVSGEWDMLNRVDVAMIILDEQCRMYRVNRSAREMLDEAKILRRGKGGIFTVDPAQMQAFQTAVATCASSPVGQDQVLLLSSFEDGYQVPLTLTRYIYEGEPTRYVVGMLPTPPSSARVEALVRQMGLTSSEARVAALMQLGLSNREAAEISGLKVQTFNTYAKRVLSKLNVSGRTEMAQLLTWQASGGRAS